MHPVSRNPVPQYPRTPGRTSQPIVSAFSACANPNEDWTKLSDFGERRRIQSRIAQRNYRTKQRQRLKQAKTSTPELTHEELATPESPPDFSPIDPPQDEIQGLYDMFTCDAAQQQETPPSSDDGTMPVQQFTPQLSTEQSTTGSTSCLHHSGTQQQPTPSFHDASFLQQSPPFNNDCVMPLQQFPPATQSSCAHTPTSNTTSYLFNNSHQQQPLHSFHNFCAHKAPQQQFQAWSQHCDMCPPQRAHPLIPTSQPPYAYMPTPTSAAYQSQRKHNPYDRAPPRAAAWTGSDNYARASYGQMEASWGAPAVDLNAASFHALHPLHPYMPLPLPTERGCYCHHSHTFSPATPQPVSVNGVGIPHPYQDSRMLF